jgi:hypothetical protein
MPMAKTRANLLFLKAHRMIKYDSNAMKTPENTECEYGR